ncbi:glycosyl transferase family group 2-domain-containing protein [Xylariaceae sp. FL0016]|nr:glycosyl transferase family group 2-domain-containing protein [Xylariaceae sp. FL0016]
MSSVTGSAAHLSRQSSGDQSHLSQPSFPRAHRDSQYAVSKAMLQGQVRGDAAAKAKMLVQFLYRRFREQGWLESDPLAESNTVAGLVLLGDSEQEELSKRYTCQPHNMDSTILGLASRLHLGAVAVVSSDITSYVFSELQDAVNEVTLRPHNITVPVVANMAALARQDSGITRRDFCCLLRQERMIIVWAQSGEDIMAHIADVESKLMGSIWGVALPETPSRLPTEFKSHSGTPQAGRPRNTMSRPGSVYTGVDEKDLAVVDDIDLGAEDEESLEAPSRPFLLTHSVMVGLAMGLLVVIEALSIRLIVIQVRALGKSALPRLGLLATLPVFMWFTLFFVIVVIGTLFQIFGPITDVRQGNSHFYSSRAPDKRRHPDMVWPHITIQMPVYKEGLKGVIIPTLNSVLAAIRHYENLGGTASIYVCEDGMQASKPEVAEMRQQFYQANGIGWCARPAHGNDGFVRAGKFKKASNMNYCLSFSLRVEDELLQLLKQKSDAENRPQEDFTIEEEEVLYQQALETALAQDGGKTMAAGNVRMGEIILIIDCDTRVPVDCLSLGALEMEESPEVAIIQHASGVMQVINTVFENAITYFTDLVYLLIRFSVGSGDCAPFVGHNAFLRWKAIQSVSFMENGEEKFWSENHVSEDFDMSLRLQTAGFIVRLATYDHGEFKEGVSLTAFDELLRWEKYSYGCSELIFHPVYQWIYKGPFTELFVRFLFSNMKYSAKFTILGYIGTYYAIGAALPLSVVNYFLTGWIPDQLDHSYLPSFDMLCGTLFVFLVASPITFAWYRHRLGQKNLFWALVEAFTWMPFFLIFFGGLSWHISYALLAHMFVLPIEWSSTAKELESTGFFVGIESVLKQFKYVIFFMLVLTAGIIYLAVGAPDGWQISGFTSILPLSLQIVGHLGLPIFTILF